DLVERAGGLVDAVEGLGVRDGGGRGMARGAHIPMGETVDRGERGSRQQLGARRAEADDDDLRHGVALGTARSADATGPTGAARAAGAAPGPRDWHTLEPRGGMRRHDGWGTAGVGEGGGLGIEIE